MTGPAGAAGTPDAAGVAGGQGGQGELGGLRARMRVRRPGAATPFGECLVALMEARGLSAAETARRAGCSAGYLCNVIHGRKRPSARVAARLDDVLEAGGELVTLAETTEVVTSDDDEPAASGNPVGQAPGTRVAAGGGLSLSLPYVPGRLLNEMSGPAEGTAQLAGGGNDRTAAGARLALVPRSGGVDDGGTEVTGA